MKLFRVMAMLLLAVFPMTVSAQNTANLTFRQSSGTDDFAGWYTAVINSFSSPAWPFGQVGTTIRIVCVDRDNFIGGEGTVWNVRVNYLSNPDYKSMRRGYYPDAEARYKKAAYIYSKLPNTPVANRAPLYNMINFFVGLRSGVAPLDTALLTEVNTWYNAGAFGINWSEVAVLTDVQTSLVAIGDTMPAQGGAQEFMAFARPQTPTLLPWKPRQQLLVLGPANISTGLRESQTAAFQAYARTSAGVPVAAPLVTWTLVGTGINIQSTTNVSAVLATAATLTGQTTAKLIGTWSTRSGVFKDSVLFPVVATSTTLPWQPRQQVLTLVSDTAKLTYNSKVVLTTYTRTSQGVPVNNPKITYTVSNPLVRLNPLSNQSVQLVMPAQQLGDQQITVWAEWKTSSGALTSQTVFTTRY